MPRGTDGSPFPVSSILASLDGRSVIEKVLGAGEYRAHRIGDTVFLIAVGGAPLNVEVSLEQSLTTVFPPSFALYFIVPQIILPAQKSFYELRTFVASENVPSVIVFDAEGRHEVPVDMPSIAPSALVAGGDHGNPRTDAEGMLAGNDMGNANASGVDMGNAKAGGG